MWLEATINRVIDAPSLSIQLFLRSYSKPYNRFRDFVNFNFYCFILLTSCLNWKGGLIMLNQSINYRLFFGIYSKIRCYQWRVAVEMLCLKIIKKYMLGKWHYYEALCFSCFGKSSGML